MIMRAGQNQPAAAREEQQKSEIPFNFTSQIVHLHKDHSLFEVGDVNRHLYLQDLYVCETDAPNPAVSVSQFACHISGCSAVFIALEEYEHHYNSLHRHVCCSCRRSLPSARLLDIHIQEWHDSLFTILAQRQDMYQCLVEGCGEKFRTSQHRKDHLVKIHKYPPDFRFDKPKKDKRAKETTRLQQKDTEMEVTEEVCDSEGVCEVLWDVLCHHPESGESMEMHVSEKEANGMTNHASGTEQSSEPPRPEYFNRVPRTVCFGHGSVRGFRGRRGRRK